MKRLEINIQSPAQYDSQIVHIQNDLNSPGSFDQEYDEEEYQQSQQQEIPFQKSQVDNFLNSEDSPNHQWDNRLNQKDEFQDIQVHKELQGLKIQAQTKRHQNLQQIKRKNLGIQQTFHFLQSKNQYISENYKQTLENDSEVDRIIREVMNKNHKMKGIVKNQKNQQYRENRGYSHTLIKKTKTNHKLLNQGDEATRSQNVNETNREIYSQNLLLYKQIGRLQKRLQNLTLRNKKKKQKVNFTTNGSIKEVKINKFKSQKELQLQKIMRKLEKALNISTKLNQRIDFQKSKLTLMYSNLSISGSKINYQRSLSKQKETQSKSKMRNQNDKYKNKNNNSTINLGSEGSGIQNFTYRVKSPSLIEASSRISKNGKIFNINDNFSKLQSYNSPILKYKDFVLNQDIPQKAQEKLLIHSSKAKKNNKHQDQYPEKKDKRSKIYIKDESQFIPRQNNPQTAETKPMNSKKLKEMVVHVNLSLQQFDSEWIYLQEQEKRLMEKIQLNSQIIKRYQERTYEQAIK